MNKVIFVWYRLRQSLKKDLITGVYRGYPGTKAMWQKHIDLKAFCQRALVQKAWSPTESFSSFLFFFPLNKINPAAVKIWQMILESSSGFNFSKKNLGTN